MLFSTKSRLQPTAWSEGGDVLLLHFFEVEAQNTCFALRYREFGIERFEERAFSCTHLSHEVDEVVLVHFEIDVVQYDLVVELQLHVVILDEHDSWVVKK